MKRKTRNPEKLGRALGRDEGNSYNDGERKSRMTAGSRSRDDQHRLEQEDVRSREGVSKKEIELRHDVFDHSEFHCFLRIGA